MKVPLLDLKPQYKQIEAKVMPEIMKVIENQAFILGPRVEKTEKEFAEYIGTKFTIGCSSGTDALILALMALDIGKGDEVITTPYTFFATASAIARVGAKPVFVDIEPDTYLIDANKIEAAITPSTKAIMPVHLFGQCADMDAIMDIAKKHNLKVVEDAAQAIGATYKGKGAGSIGDIGCFSFFPSKNLGCFGDGGLVSTNSEEIATRIKGLRVHGGMVQYQHLEIGLNARFDALQAAVVSVKLPYLNEWTDGRIRNATKYESYFKPVEGIQSSVTKENCRHIFNQYVINVENRDELRKHLTEKEIGCSVYYPLSLHQQKCFGYLGYKEGDFPNSEYASKHTLALPVYSELPAESQKFVAETIIEFVNSKSNSAEN